MARSSRVKCEHADKCFELNALRKSIIAFEKIKPTSKHKRETLYYAYEQVKPLIKRYMKANNILALEVDTQTFECMALEPVQNFERNFFVERWLEGNLSTREFKRRLKQRFQWVGYFSFADFLRGVEAWLVKQKESE